MVCQYCIKYNCRTVSVFAHSSVVCCCCCCSIVFFLVQIIITCEIIIIFFVCKLIYYLVSLGGVLPISLLWSHHEVMQFLIIYKVFFLLFAACPKAFCSDSQAIRKFILQYIFVDLFVSSVYMWFKLAFFQPKWMRIVAILPSIPSYRQNKDKKIATLLRQRY